MLVKPDIGDKSFQSPIFLPPLPEAAQIAHAHVLVLLFPVQNRVVLFPSYWEKSLTGVSSSAWRRA